MAPKEMLDKLIAKITAFKWPVKTFSSTKRCCFHLMAQGMAVVVADYKEAKGQLIHAEFVPKNDLTILGQWVTTYNLKSSECIVIIEPKEYELLFLDPLPLKPDEINAALQWRIKEMISYPVTEAQWDYFEMPSGRPEGNRLQVVVSRKAYIAGLMAQAHKLHLNLTRITIPELSLLKMVKLLPEEKNGVGFLALETSPYLFFIAKNGCLYFWRHLSEQWHEAAIAHVQDSKLESLALEIQRSFDYYQSEMHETAPALLLVSGMTAEAQKNLAAHLTYPVQLFNPESILRNNFDFTVDLPPECTVAMGGILQLDKEHETRH